MHLGKYTIRALAAVAAQVEFNLVNKCPDAIDTVRNGPSGPPEAFKLAANGGDYKYNLTDASTQSYVLTLAPAGSDNDNQVRFISSAGLKNGVTPIRTITVDGFETTKYFPHSVTVTSEGGGCEDGKSSITTGTGTGGRTVHMNCPLDAKLTFTVCSEL